MVIESVLMVSAGFLFILFFILFVILLISPKHEHFENRKEKKELDSIKKQINGDEEAW